MPRINLLPHREIRRKQQGKQFYSLLVLAALLALGLAILASMVIGQMVSTQDSRNATIKAENARLDIQIKEVANLKAEIEGLKARQKAVEDLQSDRNQPVYLLDDLAKHTPEGVYLKSIKQEGQRVLLTGYAQSNERVSDFLRAITQQSTWLEKPDLVEIKASTVGAAGKEQKRIFEFSMNVGIKRASDTNTRVPSNDANKPINNATQGIAPAPTITTPTVVAPSVAVPSAVAPSTNSVVKGK